MRLRDAEGLLDGVDPLLHSLPIHRLKPHRLAANGVEGKDKVALGGARGDGADGLHLLEGEGLAVRLVALTLANDEVPALEHQEAVLPRLTIDAAELADNALEANVLIDGADVLGAGAAALGGAALDLNNVLGELVLGVLGDASVLLDSLEEHAEALLDVGHLEDVSDGGALVGVDDEDELDNVAELLAILLGQRGELAVEDLRHEALHVGRGEGALEGEDFVQEDAEGPHVSLLVVALVVPELGGEVVGGAAEGVGNDAGDGVVVLVAEAEVAELDEAGRGEEDVRALDIAVEHFVAVDVVEGEADLQEEEEGLVLLEVAEVIGGAGLDLAVEIARVGELHNNQQLVILLVVLDVADNVGVLAVGQALDLRVGVLLIAGAHLAQVHHLRDEDVAIGDALGEPRLTIRAGADELTLKVEAVGGDALLPEDGAELLGSSRHNVCV